MKQSMPVDESLSTQQEDAGCCYPPIHPKGRPRFGEISDTEAGLLDGVTDEALFQEFIASPSYTETAKKAANASQLLREHAVKLLKAPPSPSKPQSHRSSHQVAGCIIAGLGSEPSGTPRAGDHPQDFPQRAPVRGMRSPLSWPQIAGSQIVGHRSNSLGTPRFTARPQKVPQRDRTDGIFDVRAVPSGMSTMPQGSQFNNGLSTSENLDFEEAFEGSFWGDFDLDSTEHTHQIGQSSTELLMMHARSDIDADLPTANQSHPGIESKLVGGRTADIMELDSLVNCLASTPKTSRVLPAGKAEGQQEAQSSRVVPGVALPTNESV